MVKTKNMHITAVVPGVMGCSYDTKITNISPSGNWRCPICTTLHTDLCISDDVVPAFICHYGRSPFQHSTIKHAGPCNSYQDLLRVPNTHQAQTVLRLGKNFPNFIFQWPLMSNVQCEVLHSYVKDEMSVHQELVTMFIQKVSGVSKHKKQH